MRGATRSNGLFPFPKRPLENEVYSVEGLFLALDAFSGLFLALQGQP